MRGEKNCIKGKDDLPLVGIVSCSTGGFAYSNATKGNIVVELEAI